jgi:hypothetical protein
MFQATHPAKKLTMYIYTNCLCVPPHVSNLTCVAARTCILVRVEPCTSEHLGSHPFSLTDTNPEYTLGHPKCSIAQRFALACSHDDVQARVGVHDAAHLAFLRIHQVSCEQHNMHSSAAVIVSIVARATWCTLSLPPSHPPRPCKNIPQKYFAQLRESK